MDKAEIAKELEAEVGFELDALTPSLGSAVKTQPPLLPRKLKERTSGHANISQNPGETEFHNFLRVRTGYCRS